MSTSKDYMDFLLDQLSVLEGITYRRMMGEYLLYYRKKVAAYICDDRFFKRPVQAAVTLLPDAPYDSIDAKRKEKISACRPCGRPRFFSTAARGNV